MQWGLSRGSQWQTVVFALVYHTVYARIVCFGHTLVHIYVMSEKPPPTHAQMYYHVVGMEQADDVLCCEFLEHPDWLRWGQGGRVGLGDCAQTFSPCLSVLQPSCP